MGKRKGPRRRRKTKAPVTDRSFSGADAPADQAFLPRRKHQAILIPRIPQVRSARVPGSGIRIGSDANLTCAAPPGPVFNRLMMSLIVPFGSRIIWLGSVPGSQDVPGKKFQIPTGSQVVSFSNPHPIPVRLAGRYQIRDPSPARGSATQPVTPGAKAQFAPAVNLIASLTSTPMPGNAALQLASKGVATSPSLPTVIEGEGGTAPPSTPMKPLVGSSVPSTTANEVPGSAHSAATNNATVIRLIIFKSPFSFCILLSTQLCLIAGPSSSAWDGCL